VNRVQLERERQQREDAERQKKELEERLRRYEEECEKAKLGTALKWVFLLCRAEALCLLGSGRYY
jgi:hypothetical protein